ncbi:MAG TPA: DUF5666 domain-containing protein [Candidatus Acidoferrales bacterium]|nr:DUF5666 domain-containing protein [Candidatus Acidoferrales bacterium]
MRFGKSLGVFCAGLLVFLGGCTNSMNTTPPNGMGNVFSLVTDAAPTLPGVVSFQVMITGVTVNNAGGSLSVLTNPATIDFARFSGLHELLDLDTVPPGQYTSVTITGSSPIIGFLDTSGGSGVPPVLNTMNATPSTFSVTVPLTKTLVVDQTDMVGLLIDLDLGQTIQTSGGFVTGTVNPTFDVRGLTADDAQAEIDDFRGGVVSVDTSSNAFTMTGARGRNWNVTTDSQTEFDDGATFANLAANDIVEVSGKLDPVTRGIKADEVEVLSQDGFFAGGLTTFVSPASPAPATQIQVYVRAELPNLSTTAPIGQIDSFALNGSEKYYIADFRNPLTALLFSNTTLAPGQRVGIGGVITTSGGSSSLTVHRVVLGRQGQQGMWVVGSTQVQSGNAGSFQLNDNFLAGVLLPQPVTVITTNFTNFVNLAGLSALTGSGPIHLRVVGFVLMDQQTNQPVIMARRVEQLNP